MNKRKVLLIEDNPMNMELATDLLKGFLFMGLFLLFGMFLGFQALHLHVQPPAVGHVVGHSFYNILGQVEVVLNPAAHIIAQSALGARFRVDDRSWEPRRSFSH